MNTIKQTLYVASKRPIIERKRFIHDRFHINPGIIPRLHISPRLKWVED